MRILVFSTHAGWQPHLETELEIIQEHLDKGDEVYRFICNGDFQICDLNQEHILSACLQCRDMASCGKTKIDGIIKDLPIIHENPEIQKALTTLNLECNSIAELKATKIGNFDLGIAVLSSLISWKREPTLEFKVHAREIKLALKTTAEVYFSALKYIEDLQADQVYCFNGRLMHGRAILRASTQKNVTCFVHERGNSMYHYALYKNTTPHDRSYVVESMNQLWEQAENKARDEIGSKFYTERVSGKNQAWYSFVENQQKGLLPSNWDENKRNMAIFNSSEDEFAAIGDAWKNELYESQLSAIQKIVHDTSKHPEIHFYLRVHPNLSDVINSETKRISEFNYENLTVIDAKSQVSTYDLLFNCEKTISFGSSVGIEAVYWGKPSIQLGKSYYFDMETTYKPSTHEETLELILKTLEPMPKLQALIYGHYFKTYGIPFKNYIPDNLATGKYKGINIYTEALKKHPRHKSLSRYSPVKLPYYLLGLVYKFSRRKLFSFLLSPEQKAP